MLANSEEGLEPHRESLNLHNRFSFSRFLIFSFSHFTISGLSTIATSILVLVL